MKRLLTLVAGLIMTVAAMALENGSTVRLECGGKSLIMTNSSLDVSTAAVMWTETNTNSQRWILTENGRGGYYLQNVYSGFYLGAISSTGSGGNVGQVAQSAVSSRGTWYIEPVEGKEDTYVIYLNSARRVALATAAEVTEGSVATLQTAAQTDEARIHWRIEAVEALPNQFTEAMRDDMMAKFKARHYKKQSTGYSIDNGGWWGDAEMFETILDAYETTGNMEYATMFDNLYENFIVRNKSSWYQSGVSGYNAYNDDIAWMCIACTRAYLLTGTAKYLSTARTNFNGMFKRADCYGNDLLQWKHGSGQGTNSCINGPATVCACYLAIATADMSYYEKAKKTYLAHRKLLYEFSNGKPTGQVWDSYDQEAKKYNYWASTYNQGTSLGAALMLYDYYKDPMYKEDADAIIKWTVANMANTHGIVKACQTVRGDLCGFKGILMRYIRRYAEDMGHPEYYDWMAKNAYHAWNNRNSSGITSSAWLYKAEEDFKHQEGTELKTFESFGNSTCLSAAFNAHLGAVDKHDAYKRIEAEHFNFLRGAARGTAPAEEGSETDVATTMGSIQNAKYVGFRDVDFGTKPASHILLRANMLRTASRLRVYADHPTKGTLLTTIATTDAEAQGQWGLITKELDFPIEGMHDIYLVGYGNSGIALADIDWFRFEARHTIFADLTNMGGRLTASATTPDTNLCLMTDDSPLTDAAIQSAEGEAWVQYVSDTPVRLQGYAVFSPMAAGSDPTAWTLKASNDGTQWTVLDTQSDATFSARGQKKQFALTPDADYTHFRLCFENVAEAASVALSEWQLMGQGILPTDITADGGTLSNDSHNPLTDKDIATTVTMAQPQEIIYQSDGKYRLTAYTLTATSTSTAPTAWTLYGSGNGTTWTALDSRQEQSFPYDHSTNAYALGDVESYVYYKLSLEGDGNAELAEWQLLGALDFGAFYADVTRIANVTAADGSAVEGLTDDNGHSYASVAGDAMKWKFTFPIDVRVLGYSVISADDSRLDPKGIQMVGTKEDIVTTISTRTLSLGVRGSRVTATVSSTRTFHEVEFQVNTTAGDTAATRVAELEIYGTAIAEEGHRLLPATESVTASAPGLATNEGIEKLSDQTRTTKYHADLAEPVAILTTYNEPKRIDTYAITAAKDEPSRDPASWRMEGSNDGETWTLLDERSGESFSQRYATQFYTIAEPKEYTQYRLTVSEAAKSTHLQMAQLQLLTMQDETGIARTKTPAAATIALARNILTAETPQATVLRIYDMQGRIRLAQPIAAGRQFIDLSPLPTGTYIAAMLVDGRNVICKICR
ncbi:MAG: carbohydrate-binding protein [Bacteroidaceae bacterium]|nr:carbohydrate-binding protein [Bacteroidaceae bacterium]